ncbi:MAG TPA: 16S rRNA (cytosine(1402)-N(4))-methyltransferase RsmH [Verrucomicrobiae bacterium]|nr:16S rRNA (cytosine(1402)-N(4))-methyltransferase RsmH [Verrucomicrobiae bacterium]
MQAHLPVMLDESLTGLSLRAGGTYVDLTFGRGGHSGAILQRLGGQGALHAFDRDPAAAGAASDLARQHANFHFHSTAFAGLADVAAAHGIAGRIDGILLDLGVSSPQFDDAARGFSFGKDGPLDMRMDPRHGESAAEWLARAAERDIADVLWTLGEERGSRHIARAIVQARTKAPLISTAQLAELILSVHRGPRQKIHPATRSFQAIRIHVNQELEQLRAVLEQSITALAPGGRLVAISFHSLEDRIVKRFMRDQSRPSSGPGAGGAPRLKRVGKAQFPGDAEAAANPRARSAVLRVAEKLA